MNEAERERLIWEGAIIVFLISMFSRADIKVLIPDFYRYIVPFSVIMAIIVIEVIYLHSNKSINGDE